MRYLEKTSIILICTTMLWSCRELPALPTDDRTLARVGRRELRTSEVATLIPQTLTGADSAEFAKACIDRWIVKQLKAEEAEKIFHSSHDDIEAQVEEYRQSLLIKKIDQYCLDSEPVEISEAEVEAYYNARKSDFRLERTVVKGVVVAFGEKFRQKDKLLENMRSPKESAQQEFRDMCIKNNFRLYELNEWTDFADFLALLPTVRAGNYESLTARSDVQKMNADGVQYYFRITDVLKAGDTRPFDMSRESIARMLETQRRGEIIRRHETEITEAAIESGHVKIYSE